MSLWAKVETAPERAAVFSWKRRFGTAFSTVQAWFLKKPSGRASAVPCPNGCSCFHRINEENEAVCHCGECEPIQLTAEDAQTREVDWKGLQAKVRDALGLNFKEVSFGLPRLWQVGTHGSGGLPVVLVVQPERAAFNEALAQLTARIAEPFAVLTPTTRYDDIAAKDLLGRRGAKILDLESNLFVNADGALEAVRSARELFAEFVPGAGRSVAAREQVGSRYAFRLAGSMCDVVFEGRKLFHIKNTDGAKYLNYLLHHPNRAIRASDLEVLIKPEKSNARGATSIQKRLDARAKREATAELHELEEELAEAESLGLPEKMKRLESEIKTLKGVTKDDGLLDADSGERARDNVRKAIEKVIKNLRKGDADEQAFGRHVSQFVSLGYEVIYNQPEVNDWS